MKNLVKKHTLILIIIIILVLVVTFVYMLNKKQVSANSVNFELGICKIYRDNEVFYYRETPEGSYSDNATEQEVVALRNNIKQTINSLDNGEYLIGKILKSDSYYDETNKEFCFKRNASSVSKDTLTKVIIVGYDDNYQFKSNLASEKGAYKVKKLGTTEEFYVSYEDSWVEAELEFAHDANSITLDKTQVELKVGETVEVKYAVLPEDALSKGVSISYSEGIEIDTNTSGTVKITGISVTEDAYIIVKLKENKEITAKCDIKVVSDLPVEPSPTPTPNPSPNPEPSPTPVIPTITPEPIGEEEITSNKYLVDTGKKYISRITPKIKISEFKSNVTANVDYSIYDKNNAIISDENQVVATGMKVKTQSQEYVMIVKGDINGDGKISITDLVKIKLYNAHIQTPSEIEEISADINGDGKISITDLVQLKLASVGIKEIG